MKNRGLLTRPTTSPLGAHKDLTPADLPNQQVANLAAELSQNETTMPDPRPPHPNPPAEKSGPPLRAAASSAPTGTAKRYTLVLRLDAELHQRLEAWLRPLVPSARSVAKRAMLLAFRSHLTVIPLKTASVVPPYDAVPHRIDIRLPDPLVRQLLAAAGQTAFEPKTTALARSLAPHFADFVREALGPMPAAASENRVAEPTMGDSTVHR